MKIKNLIPTILIISLTGCSSTSDFFKNISPFKKEEQTLEPKKSVRPSDIQKSDEIFVCAGDIDAAYKKMGEVSLGEFGFSGHDVLSKKIREKASAVNAQAVINVQYDTGASKSWKGYGELGGTDYGVKYTSWCNGTAILLLESHNPIGLIFCNLTSENKDWFGYKTKQTGAIVVNVKQGSMAETAGVRVEDLVTECNGEKIENKRHLEQLISTNAGREASLSILRAGEVKMVTLSIPKTRGAHTVSASPKTYSKEKTITAEKKGVASHKPDIDDAKTYNEVGDLYLKKGMYDEAIEEYKNAIETDPDYAIAHFNLSIAYDKVGLKEEADEEYAIYKKLKQNR